MSHPRPQTVRRRLVVFFLQFFITQFLALDDITEEIPMEFKYNHKFGDYPKTNSQAQLFSPQNFEFNRKFGAV